MEKKGFLEDQPGRKSSTNLVFVTGCWAILGMAWMYVYKGQYTPFDVGSFLAMSLGALGVTKTGVKYVNKSKKTSPEPENKG